MVAVEERRIVGNIKVNKLTTYYVELKYWFVKNINMQMVPINSRMLEVNLISPIHILSLKIIVSVFHVGKDIKTMDHMNSD